MSAPQTPIGRGARNRLLIGAFLAAICLPMAGMLLGLAPHLTLHENRQIAPLPHFGWHPAELKMFAYEMKPYLRDNFGFRPTLIRWHHRLKGHVLGVSSSPNVLLGKEGWLFYNSEQVVEDYRCVKPFEARELDSLQRIFEQERDLLAKEGIRYILVIVPNTHTLYPEYLPDWVTRVRSESRLDQFAQRMRANSTVEFLDLRAPLLQAKRQMRVSCRTDTHWNSYGAFTGVQAVMQRLSAWFPAMTVPRIEDFTWATRTRPGGDLARMIDASEERQEEAIELEPRLAPRAVRRETRPETLARGVLLPAISVAELPGAAPLPSAVMLHDSSAGDMMPYLSENFRRIVFVWTKRFQRGIIEEERPDVVIREFTERFLMQDPAKFLDQDVPHQPDDVP